MAKEAYPLDYSTALRVIRDSLLGVSPAPVVVSEGANTMDNARHAFDSICTVSSVYVITADDMVHARRVV